MKKTNISTIKGQLSKYLNFVKSGHTVRIFDRDLPVADLVPIEQGSEHFQQLEKDGVVRCGRGKLDKDFFKTLVTLSDGKNSMAAVDAVILERDRER